MKLDLELERKILLYIKNYPESFAALGKLLDRFQVTSGDDCSAVVNKKNIKNLNIMNSLFQRNFDYSNYKILYETNGFKVYKPADGLFCNSFSGFCSYQSFKVIIEEKKNYLFIIKNTRS